jgi:hypothetical protein
VTSQSGQELQVFAGRNYRKRFLVILYFPLPFFRDSFRKKTLFIYLRKFGEYNPGGWAENEEKATTDLWMVPVLKTSRVTVSLYGPYKQCQAG